MDAAPDINYWLGRKYAILAQEADTGQQNAATGATVGSAAAALDRTRAGLLPAESKAQIGQTQAQAGLLRQQASVVAPEAFARIRNLDAEGNVAGANVGLIGAQTNDVSLSNRLYPGITNSSGPLASVLGARGYTGYRLGQ